MPKTDFNQLYIKAENAGFVGVKAMVRTPSRSEVMASILSEILHIMSVVLDGKTEQVLSASGVAFMKSLPSKKRDDQFNELANNLYFESCMMNCGDPECREWVDVYGLGGETFCHVSECQLFPLEQAPEESEEPVGVVSVEDFIKSRMDAIAKEAIDIGGKIEPVCNMSLDRQGIYYQGYAAALASILSALKGGDVLKDV